MWRIPANNSLGGQQATRRTAGELQASGFTQRLSRVSQRLSGVSGGKNEIAPVHLSIRCKTWLHNPCVTKGIDLLETFPATANYSKLDYVSRTLSHCLPRPVVFLLVPTYSYLPTDRRAKDTDWLSGLYAGSPFPLVPVSDLKQAARRFRSHSKTCFHNAFYEPHAGLG